MANPITWRNIDAPDATGAARILEMAGNNIAKGVGAVKSSVDSYIIQETDSNVAALAQQIMGAGEGIDGLNNLSGIQNTLSQVDAANFGGTEGLNNLMNMATKRRDDLEAEAIGSFNEILSQAQATGDYSQVNAIKGDLSSSIRNAAPLLDAANKAEATYKANNYIQGIARGELDAATVLKDTSIDWANPINTPILEAARTKVNNEKVGNILMNASNFIKRGQTDESVDTIMKSVTAGLTPDEIAQNYGIISSIQDQIISTKAKASELNQAELNTLDAMRQSMNFEEMQFNARIKADEDILKADIGERPKAISNIEVARENLINESIRKTLGKEADDPDEVESAKNKIQRIQAKHNLSNEALLYAVQKYGELSDNWFDNEDAFVESIKSADKALKSDKAAWAAFDRDVLDRKRNFNNYLNEEKVKISNYISSAPKSRMGGSPNYTQSISSYAGYLDRFPRQTAQAITTGNTSNTRTEPAPASIPAEQKQAYNAFSAFEAAFNATGKRSDKGVAADVYDALKDLQERTSEDSTLLGSATAGLGALAGTQLGALRNLGLDIKEVASLITMTKKEREEFFKKRNKESN